jgi:excisionase family DNA binding protein
MADFGKQPHGHGVAHSGPWLTLGQAAKQLGVANRTLRRWAAEGRLPAFSTPGGHRRFRLSDLEGFLADAEVAPAEEKRAPSVLVIDDDGRRSAAVRYGLEAEGYHVREASAPGEADAAVDEAAPDLILMNVALDGLDGLDLLCRLRARHGLEAVSVVMFTTRGRDGDTTTIVPPRPAPLVDAARRVLSAAPAAAR